MSISDFLNNLTSELPHFSTLSLLNQIMATKAHLWIYQSLRHRNYMPAPWPQTNVWIHEKNELSGVLEDAKSYIHAPLPLRQSAQDILAKLKQRTPKAIEAAQWTWYGLNLCKLKSITEGINGNDLFNYIGVLNDTLQKPI